MKRLLAMAVILTLMIISVGCTTDDDTGATTTGAPTTTTTAVNVDPVKLVAKDIRKVSNLYKELAISIPCGTMYPPTLPEMEDPKNEGAQFCVYVTIKTPLLGFEVNTVTRIVEILRNTGMRAECATGMRNYQSFYAQGTKEQIEAIPTLEPSFGYYLHLGPPPRPEGYNPVYSDVMAAWLDEVGDEEKVKVWIIPSWNSIEMKTPSGELINADRQFTQEEQEKLIRSGQVEARTKAIGERYRGEQINAWSENPYNEILYCVVTKQEILKMVDDPEIRYVELYEPVY